MKSHIKAIETAKSKGLEYVLLFEDDAVPVEGFMSKLKEAMKELPDNWDALWLNGTATKKALAYSRHLKRTKETWGTFAYVLHSRFYDTAISGLSELRYTADGWYTQIQKSRNIFQTAFPLAAHAQGRSEIEMAVVDKYKHLQ